uniref:DUF2236 domain-containing protein n=1 Tax=Heterorhabditis bacteriophora TaxID=37862 RepID=A0A1I7WBX4_HETBA
MVENIGNKDEKPSNKTSARDAKSPVGVAEYFMEWTSNVFQAYTRTIDELFVKPLIEHCTNKQISGKIGSKYQISTLKLREQDEVAKLTIESNMHEIEHNLLIYRLNETASRMFEWSRNNQMKTIKQHSSWTDAFPFIYTMFESTSALAEVFGLSSIDRDNVKESFKHYMRSPMKDEYYSKNNSALIIGDVKDYLPWLEARINHYRTIVYLMATSLISIVQTYMKSISEDKIDLKTREINDILERLPPMYLKVKSLKLSQYVSKLLKDYPPNKYTFPLAPKAS